MDKENINKIISKTEKLLKKIRKRNPNKIRDLGLLEMANSMDKFLLELKKKKS